jgi:hypothetical protein
MRKCEITVTVLGLETTVYKLGATDDDDANDDDDDDNDARDVEDTGPRDFLGYALFPSLIF